MEWRKTSDNTTVTEGVTHVITDNNRVVYNLTIKGNSGVKDGESYLCITKRAATENYRCKSGKINVKGTGRAYIHVLYYFSSGTNCTDVATSFCSVLLHSPCIWQQRARSHIPKSQQVAELH